MNIVLVILCLFVCVGDCNQSKRLLINTDQSALEDRFSRLESEILNQKTSLQHLLTENQHLTLENQLHTSTVQQLSSEVQKLSLQLKTLSTLSNTESHGTTFVRWAKTSCPSNNTELVYSGFVGGGMYNDKTAAPEPVCLPLDPDFERTTGNDAGRMYGGEYNDNFFIQNGDGLDVPCAVCRTRLASSVLMIPGKTRCHPSWKREYYGYLSGSHHVYLASGSYVCADIHPEYLTGSGTHSDGKLFTAVLAKCGSLQCPPYKNNYPLTCVVCSK
ncbi:unnamed protein product [Mytilus edulis]|uniref:Short-chain collagen C4-like n=1 Tax=Mytilus edulis TaxID=6550 RepID=A0A8S3SXK9_MYTED|nr:unnamed protein product [Mytilus edulis]